MKALLPKTMCLSTPRGNRWRGVDTPKPEAIDPKSDAGLRAALRALREEKAAARVAVREKQ